MLSSDTPIWQLTVGQFQELIQQSFVTKEEAQPESKRIEVVQGLTGLATLLGCSKTYACRIKTSGRIDGAIIENGRKPIFDRDKVLELMRKTKAY